MDIFRKKEDEDVNSRDKEILNKKCVIKSKCN